MCLYPRFIKNRKYLPNIKNGGVPPLATDERTLYVPIGCGQCMECRKQKARQWQVRLHEEIRNNNTGKFVTLSYSDESLIKLEIEANRLRAETLKKLNEMDSKRYNKAYKKLEGYHLDNEIAILSMRRFLERWRKKYKKSCKHWLVTELGQNNTERLHMHGLLFTDETLETVRQIWKYGNVNKLDEDWKTTYVNERTVNYIVKYVHKVDKIHPNYIPVILCSPGIGSNYLKRIDSNRNRYNDKKTIEQYTTRNGIKLPLPIYYRNKIYTDSQKEKLWLNLLDKETRYVNGIKIDVSKGQEEYERVLEEQRRINIILGYNTGHKDESKQEYEKDRRNLQRLTRIQKEHEKKRKEGF